jgi:hypothetical protein
VVAFYRSYPGRAERFEEVLFSLLAVIDASPFGFRVIDPPLIRSAPFRKFPYQLVYLADQESVEVLALFDGRRKPGIWR